MLRALRLGAQRRVGCEENDAKAGMGSVPAHGEAERDRVRNRASAGVTVVRRWRVYRQGLGPRRALWQSIAPVGRLAAELAWRTAWMPPSSGMGGRSWGGPTLRGISLRPRGFV